MHYAMSRIHVLKKITFWGFFQSVIHNSAIHQRSYHRHHPWEGLEQTIHTTGWQFHKMLLVTPKQRQFRTTIDTLLIRSRTISFAILHCLCLWSESEDEEEVSLGQIRLQVINLREDEERFGWRNLKCISWRLSNKLSSPGRSLFIRSFSALV